MIFDNKEFFEYFYFYFRRVSRLNYVPHELVDDYAQKPDVPLLVENAAKMNESNQDSTLEAFNTVDGDDEDDFEEDEDEEEEDDDDDGWEGDTRTTSFSYSSTNSTPIKSKGVGRGRPRKETDLSGMKGLNDLCLSPSNTDSNLSYPSLTTHACTRQHRRLQEKILGAVLDAQNLQGQSMHIPFFRLPSKRFV